MTRHVVRGLAPRYAVCESVPAALRQGKAYSTAGRRPLPWQLFSPSSTAVSGLISIGSWRESIRFPVCRCPLALARLIRSLVLIVSTTLFFFSPRPLPVHHNHVPPSSSRFPHARPVASRCCCWVRPRPRVAVKLLPRAAAAACLRGLQVKRQAGPGTGAGGSGRPGRKQECRTRAAAARAWAAQAKQAAFSSCGWLRPGIARFGGGCRRQGRCRCHCCRPRRRMASGAPSHAALLSSSSRRPLR
jgi:hypothetical protein